MQRDWAAAETLALIFFAPAGSGSFGAFKPANQVWSFLPTGQVCAEEREKEIWLRPKRLLYSFPRRPDLGHLARSSRRIRSGLFSQWANFVPNMNGYSVFGVIESLMKGLHLS